MDPLTLAITLPVSGPLSALVWIARQVAQAAEQEMLDPSRVDAALRQLERRLETGEIGEAAYEAAEAELLLELQDITERRSAASQRLPADQPSSGLQIDPTARQAEPHRDCAAFLQNAGRTSARNDHGLPELRSIAADESRRRLMHSGRR